jgi:hypothetical protein
MPARTPIFPVAALRPMSSFQLPVQPIAPMIPLSPRSRLKKGRATSEEDRPLACVSFTVPPEYSIHSMGMKSSILTLLPRE